MELKEAIEILKKKKEEKEKLLNEVEKTNGMPITHVYEKTQLSNELLVEIMTLDTVLQVLTIPDNADICFVGGGRTKGKTLTRTFEFGLIVGTKREREHWENKIKEKIEERKKQLEETSKRREKAKEQEEQAVLWCIEIRLDEKIKTYEELLKGE